jgi:hypothetical protein
MTMEKNKVLGLFALSIFAIALLGGFVSAVTVFSDDFEDGNLVGWNVIGDGWDNTGTLAEYRGSISSEASNLSKTISTLGFDSIIVSYDRQLGDDWEASDLFNVYWSADGTTFTLLEEIKTFNLPSLANDNADFQLKFECETSATDEFCRVDNVLIQGTAIQTEPTEIQECSTTGNLGFLDIKKIDFDNVGHSYSSDSGFSSGFGKDDEWFPLEEIEVEIEIENDGDYDVDDVEVSWGLYDTQNNEWVIDFDDEKDFNLKDGKEEVLTVNFVLDDDMDIDLEDLGDGENYRFYVTAMGTIDDNDSPNDGVDTCVSDFESASMIIESDFVVLDNIEMPEVISCGDTVTVTTNAWNIGDSDQDEVTIRVSDRENLMDVAETVDVGDIDAFDKQGVSFSFDVPRSLEEGTYSLLLKVIDEDGDVYENDFDDDQSRFTVLFDVVDCSSVEEISVSASLDSVAKAGQPLTIRTTIVNTGLDSSSFNVNAAGFAAWASSAQIDQPTVLLDVGESKDVLLTFDVAKDAKGTQNFFVEIVSESGKVTRQPVQVDIEASSLFGGFGGNAYLWGIGALNILLVIIIIIVAIRVAKR